MYDPARDIFTASDDTPADQEGASSTVVPKRKRSSSQGVIFEEPNHNQTSPGRANREAQVDKDESPLAKRPKTVPTATANPSVANEDTPKAITAASLSQISAKKRAPGSSGASIAKKQGRRRSRSPDRRSPDRSRHERRSPLARRPPSPEPITRSPTPPGRSPPRQRKRPGAAARISAVDQETVRKRQEEREQEQRNLAHAEGAARGVHDVVRQHYNQVPQRGREWRKTGSLIKGLRSFNNWVKSAIIQKFSPNENYTPGARDNGSNGQRHDEGGILVLDIGCGKGGDLQKWQAAPQRVELYVGMDPADVSIDQAMERFTQMKQERRGAFRYKNFHAEFFVKDCFGEWIGDIPIVQEVGIDGSVGPEGDGHSKRWGGGGFDVVSMMFCMHYAFESEAKARGMLRNVAGSLKKGGRFLGVIPNSDILTAKVLEYQAKKGKTIPADDDDDDDDWDPEKTLDNDGKDKAAEVLADGTEGAKSQKEILEWGNDIYRVKFPGEVPDDGVFRPPFGWKYFYFLEEAVEEVPEYVVPWEAFRAMAVDYDLELQYRKPFGDVWDAEKDDPSLGPLSERMGVRERNRGPLLVSEKELEAASEFKVVNALRCANGRQTSTMHFAFIKFRRSRHGVR